MDVINSSGKLSPEEFAARRKRELAILKASNQMLEDAKNNLIAMNEEDIDIKKYAGTQELSKSEKIKAIEEAQKENILAGQSYYGASEKEINDATYFEPDKASVKAYEKRLKMRNMTDEQMRNKKLSTASYVGDDVPDDGLIEDYTGTGKKKTTRRKRVTKKAKQEESAVEYEEKAPEIVVSQKETVETAKMEPVDLKKEEDIISKENVVDESYDFDVSSIPDYVQYDVIPLPSKGQCYKHKKSRIPVAYLTGSDENIIASPNMYRDGKLIDIILKRKVLDKTIDVDELVAGDRDAITLWLRATAYGNEFPITATNPATGKQYDTTVDLAKFEYNKFDLKSDEDGLFEYKVGKNVIKFKFLTRNDENELRETLMNQISDSEKVSILRDAVSIKESLARVNVTDEERANLNEDIDEIREIIGESVNENEDTDIYPKTVTEQMIKHTVSVNGNTDKEYIRNFIENMRAGDARKYRDYIVDNRPGVDFNIRINVPKSDGGGSFTTFLRLDDSIFITY